MGMEADWGLSIVQTALDRLGGHLTFEIGARWFVARVPFPL